MKKYDLMNFFYSIGAVVILVGVIAKFLEWKSQDALLLAGLSVEALVFTFSSIQPKTSTVVYKWENIFPELISDDNANTIVSTQERYNFLMNKYVSFLESSIESFEKLNKDTLVNNQKFQKVIESSIYEFEENVKSMGYLNESISNASHHIKGFGEIEREVKSLVIHFNELNAKSEGSIIPLEDLKLQVEDLNESLADFNHLGRGILGQFRAIDKK
jgi:gliding motility-associated protein GldL